MFFQSFNLKFQPLGKRNSVWPPPEIEAVLRASPNLKPCKRKYSRVPYYRFIEHVRRGGCAQCRELFLQLDKELKMMEYLRQHKN